MKKLLAGITSLALCLSLTACGGDGKKAFDHSADAETLLNSGAFSEALASYLPNEITKLQSAVTEARGSSVLLVIAADYGPVDTFLEG